MNRILNYIGHKIYYLPFGRRHRKQIRRFSLSKNEEIVYSSNTFSEIRLNGKESFIYKDEDWNLIKFMGLRMWNDRFNSKLFKHTEDKRFTNNYCINTKVRFEENSLHCLSRNKKNDWIFLLPRIELFSDYALEFEVIIRSVNSEFQIAFNYHGLGDRYRFNLRNNIELSFEVIKGGYFHNRLLNSTLTLELGVLYKIRLIIKQNTFQYILNDEVVMSVSQDGPRIASTGFAFILWDKENSNINTTIKNIKVYNS